MVCPSYVCVLFWWDAESHLTHSSSVSLQERLEFESLQSSEGTLYVKEIGTEGLDARQQLEGPGARWGCALNSQVMLSKHQCWL